MPGMCQSGATIYDVTGEAVVIGATMRQRGLGGEVLTADDHGALSLQPVPAPASAPPSGAAGGDLSGTYPDPSVVAIGGVPVSLPLPPSLGGTGGDYQSAAALLAGLGAAPLSGAQFTGAIAPAAQTLTDAPTITVDASTGNWFTVTLGGNRTMGTPVNPLPAQRITFEIIQPASGGPYTVTWASGYKFASSLAAPVLSLLGGRRDLVDFGYSANAGKWICLSYVIGC